MKNTFLFASARTFFKLTIALPSDNGVLALEVAVLEALANEKHKNVMINI